MKKEQIIISFLSAAVILLIMQSMQNQQQQGSHGHSALRGRAHSVSSEDMSTEAIVARAVAAATARAEADGAAPQPNSASPSATPTPATTPSSTASSAAGSFDCGQKMIIPDKYNSVYIDIGLHSSLRSPEHSKQLMIGVEASVENIVTYRKQIGLTDTGLPTEGKIILPVALGECDGFMVWYQGTKGQWSSMKKPNTDVPGQSALTTRPPIVVPCLRLSHLINLIPENVKIDYLKVDTQAVDYLVVKSAGETMRRVKFVEVEAQTTQKAWDTYGNGQDTNKPENHIAFFESVGFKLERTQCTIVDGKRFPWMTPNHTQGHVNCPFHVLMFFRNQNWT